MRAQGYGDGKGDPAAENPQGQPGSGSKKQKAEHPGPEPPAEGKGTGGGPTKAGDSTKSPSEASANSGGSRSKEAKETGSSPTGGSLPNSKGTRSYSTSTKNTTTTKESEQEGTHAKSGAKPMINDKAIPGKEQTPEQKAEVEQHNKEFEQRHDRAPSAENDAVDEKFWKGHGGSDKQP